MQGIYRIVIAGLLALPAAAPGYCAEGAGGGRDKGWCSFTDGKCSQWPEAALPPGEAALIKKIEARSRAAYIDIFTRNNNPAGLEAAKLLREHPEITFKTGLYSEVTAGNWCVGEEQAVYTDLRYLKEGRMLDKLAGEGDSFSNFVEGNAPFIAHELVHMRAFYERRGLKNGPAVPEPDPSSPEWVASQALKALPLTAAEEQPGAQWTERYRDAEEYLAYLVEQSYVGFEMLKDLKFTSGKGAMGTEWRWGYYVDAPEKYCRKVLKTSCSHAGLEDVKALVSPGLDDFYKRSIARQKKIRVEIISRLKKTGKKRG